MRLYRFCPFVQLRSHRHFAKLNLKSNVSERKMSVTVKKLSSMPAAPQPRKHSPRKRAQPIPGASPERASHERRISHHFHPHN